MDREPHLIGWFLHDSTVIEVAEPGYESMPSIRFFWDFDTAVSRL